MRDDRFLGDFLSEDLRSRRPEGEARRACLAGRLLDLERLRDLLGPPWILSRSADPAMREDGGEQAEWKYRKAK